MNLAFWRKKSALPPMAISQSPEEFAQISNVMATETKNFDWYHYQMVTESGISSLFQSEFNSLPTIRVLKSLYLQEQWINACISVISKQFMDAKFQIEFTKDIDGNKQIIKKHAFLDFLNNAGRENKAFFTANNVSDLTLAGNNYWWYSQDLKNKMRLPAERVEPVIVANEVQSYRIIQTGDAGFKAPAMVLSPDEVVHLKWPNPFSINVGLSMIIALNLPVLIEKYGLEFIIGFFLRGGNSSGIIETNSTNGEQLLRLAKTIMQAFGGRRNMHSDKILPQGATWKGKAGSFSEIQLLDTLKENVNQFKAATGCTDTVLGLAQNSNRATATTELELFWKMTILPIQKIYCAGIMSSSLWTKFGFSSDYELSFDNSKVEWLDPIDRLLEQDAKLAKVLTVNERRERLGVEPLERVGDKFESEIVSARAGQPPEAPQQFSVLLNPEKSVDEISNWKSVEKQIQEVPKKTDLLFAREFSAWEEIVLANIDDRKAAEKSVKARAKDFSKKFSKETTPNAMHAYDNQLKAVRTTKGFKKKADENEEKIQLLRERARQYVQEQLAKNAEASFYGYSDNEMARVYNVIEDGIKAGKNFNDIAVDVRSQFGEFYEGQANTIVRTEYGSAIAIGQDKFGRDLATVSKKMSKTWVTMEDEFVREDHKALDGAVVEGPSDEVPDMPFELDGNSYLLYPRQTGEDPGKVINCRCSIQYDVVEWSDE